MVEPIGVTDKGFKPLVSDWCVTGGGGVAGVAVKAERDVTAEEDRGG